MNHGTVAHQSFQKFCINKRTLHGSKYEEMTFVPSTLQAFIYPLWHGSASSSISISASIQPLGQLGRVWQVNVKHLWLMGVANITFDGNT